MPTMVAKQSCGRSIPYESHCKIKYLNIPRILDVEMVMKEVENDDELKKVISILKEDPEGEKKLSMGGRHIAL